MKQEPLSPEERWPSVWKKLPSEKPSPGEEPIQGRSLREVLDTNESFSLSEKLSIVFELVGLLDYLHSQGIVHRDLRPENLVLGAEGALYLRGFGFAKFLGEQQRPEGAERVPHPRLLGSPGYMPPEQIRGEDLLEPRSDLFSVGVLLYEFLTKQKPFPGKSLPLIILATQEKEPIPLRELVPFCPASLEALCLGLLQKNKDSRPSSAREVAAALEACLREIKEPTPSPIFSSTISLQEEMALDTTQFQGVKPEEKQSPALSGAKPLPTGWELPLVEQTHYMLEGELGRGGLGKVLRARDKRLLRPVALKELLKSQKHTQERFLREALITARLQHPSIVPVYEAGRWPSGEIFYTMKLVEGRPLSQVVSETSSLEERLSLLPSLLAASEAVAYAHSQKIIHRDLKPQNILCGPFGETLVIDWGLAKDLSEKSASDAEQKDAYRTITREGLTESGSVMGTPAYMPPEQARDSQEVDERADVYSLGAILYYILSGASPYSKKSSGAVLNHLLSGPPVPLVNLQPGVPRDLLAIVEKAMAREPNKRYPSARELSEDLKKFQAGQLVGVYRYTPSELFWRWLKRYRLTVSLVSALLVVLLVGGIYSFVKIRDQRDIADQARIDAEARSNSLILLQARAKLEENRNLLFAWLKTLSPLAPGWGGARLLAQDALRRGGVLRFVLQDSAPLSMARFSQDSKHLAALRADQAIVLFDTANGKSRLLSGPEPYFVLQLLFSPRENLLAVAGDQEIHLFDIDHEQERRLSGHTGLTHEIAFSPDGELLASASTDKTVRLWELSSGSTRFLFQDQDVVSQLSFSPDGRFLAAISASGHSVTSWDLVSGTSRTLVDYPKDRLSHIAFSPDGRFFAMASFDTTIHLFELEDGELKSGTERIYTNHEEPINRLLFSPDGNTLASGSRDNTVSLIRLTEEPALEKEGRPESTEGRKEKVRVLPPHVGNINSMAFSPDGRVLSAASSATIRFYEVESGKAYTLTDSVLTNTDIQFSPDGRLFVSGHHEDKTLCLWSLAEKEEPLLVSQELSFRAKISPSGLYFAFPRFDANRVHLYNLSQKKRYELGGHTGPVVDVEFSPDGSTLATASKDHSVRLFFQKESPEHFSSRILFQHEGPVLDLAFSPSGELLASVGEDKKIWLWDLARNTGRLFPGHNGAIKYVRFAPDGASFVTASDADQTIRSWDISSNTSQMIAKIDSPLTAAPIFSKDGKKLAWAASSRVYLLDLERGVVRTFSGHLGAVYDIEFSPQAGLLASASFDQTVRLWNTTSGVARVFVGHTGAVRDLEFSPDGLLLASAGLDQTIRLWDASPKQEGTKSLLVGHKSYITQLIFSPDGGTLTSFGLDWEVRLWTVQPHNAPEREPEPRESLVLESLPTEYTHSWNRPFVRRVAFSPDGKILASAGYDQQVYLFDLSSGALRTLLGHEGYITQLAFSPDGETLATASLDGTIRLFSLEAGPGHILNPINQRHPVISLAFSPDGRLLAASSEGALQLFEVASGRAELLFETGGEFIDLAFSPNGQLLAAARSGDGLVYLFDLVTKKETTFLGNSPGNQGLAFSPDGKTLATCGFDKSVRLFDLSNRLLLRAFLGHQNTVVDVAFSPDGKSIASGSTDGTARLWDVESGESMLLSGHQGEVLGVVFSPDGKTLLTTGQDQSVRFWRDALSGEAALLEAWLKEQTPAALRADGTLFFSYPKPSYPIHPTFCDPRGSASSARCLQEVLPFAQTPKGIELIDVDSDADLDLVVASFLREEGRVLALLNDGKGRFPTQETLAALKKPEIIKATDLDGDQDPDLVVLDQENSELSLLFYEAGKFLPPKTLPTDPTPMGVAVADFDLDSDVDLAVVNGLNQVSLLFQENGQFDKRGSLSTGFGAGHVLAADLDGDSDPDLVTNRWKFVVSTFRNQGAGQFEERIERFVRGNTRGVCMGDIDNDSDVDLLVSGENADTISVLFNNGKGELSQPIFLYGVLDAHEAKLVDLDQDLLLDLVVLSHNRSSILLMRNQGGGQFAPPEFLFRGETKTPGDKLAFGDLDGDGHLELITTTQEPPTVTITFLQNK